VASQGIHFLENDRAMMKANLILSKTIPKNYEHNDEIKYIEDMNKGVIINTY